MNFWNATAVVMGMIICGSASAATIYGTYSTGIRGIDSTTGVLVSDYSNPFSGGGDIFFANGTIYGLASNGTMRGINPSTGELTYQSSQSYFGDRAGGEFAYADGVFYTNNSSHLRGFDINTGELVSQFNSVFNSGEMVLGDGVLYGTYSTGIRGVDVVTGELVSDYTNPFGGSDMFYVNGTTYGLATNGTLRGINSITGKLTFQSIGGYFGDLSGGEFAYSDGIFYTNNSSHLRGFDIGTGELVSQFNSVFDSGQMVYVSTAPIPSAVWLFGSGLLGLISFAWKK